MPAKVGSELGDMAKHTELTEAAHAIKEEYGKLYAWRRDTVAQLPAADRAFLQTNIAEEFEQHLANLEAAEVGQKPFPKMQVMVIWSLGHQVRRCRYRKIGSALDAQQAYDCDCDRQSRDGMQTWCTHWHGQTGAAYLSICPLRVAR